MKSHLAIIFVSVFTAIVLSLVFIPNEKEIALMNFKGEKYEAAQKVYAERLSAGDWSVSTVMPLIQIYSHSGDILTAIDVMERFIDLNPDHFEALTLVGTLYKDAQLSSKYLLNLEKLMELKPDEKGLRELLELYAYTAQSEKRISVLRKLIEYYKYTSNDLFELAYLLARQGQREEASQILIRTNYEDPNKLDMQARKTLLSLLIKRNRTEDVIQISRDWIETKGNNEQDIAYYAEWLISQGDADPAFQLLRQIADLNNSTTALRSLFISAALDSGHTQVALEQMRTWRNEGLLSLDLFSLFLKEMLAAGDFEAALKEVAWWFDLQHPADKSFLGLIKYAYVHQKLDSLDALLAVVDPLLLNEQAIIAVEAALARNELEKAKIWIRNAEQRTDLNLDEQIVLSYQLARLGQIEQVGLVLKSLMYSTQFPSQACRDVAKLFIDIKRVAEGLSHFEVLSKTRHSTEMQSCWAMLAAAQGQEDLVLAWMREQLSLEDATLQDLYQISHKNGERRLAFESAQRLFLLRPNKLHEYYLAAALLEVDQVNEALLILENLIPAQGMIEETYLKALKAANQIEKLISYSVSRLSSDQLDPDSRTIFIRALIGVGADDQVLPHVREAVQENTGLWANDYREVLRRLHRNAEHRGFALTRLKQENITFDERRRLAFDLLDLGDKNTAISIFKTLSKNASIDSQEVRQLLYLWGPHPDGQALDWIEQKAMNSPPNERVAWFQQLLQRGGADRVIRCIESSDGAIRNSEIDRVYADALFAERKWSNLAEIIRHALKVEENRSVLGYYAELAEKTEDYHLAERVWRLILAKNPEDKEALRALGLISYKKNRFLDAESFLSKYKALYESDYEVNYIYAQVLLSLNREREAITYFQNVLTEVQSLSVRHYDDIWVEAMTLNRLGQLEQSIAVFERLLEQRPDDLNLRADFASILIDHGMHNKAQLIIDQQ